MQSIHDLWKKVDEILETVISDVSYSLWIQSLSPLELRSGEMVLLSPTNMHRNIVIEQFTPQIEDALKQVTGIPYVIRVITPDEAVPEKEEEVSGEDGLYEYTFSNFIVGSSNQFAHAASMAVAQKPGGAYNPLFIYGGSGLGKTHLLLAISNEVRRNNPKATIVYIKGDQFTNEMIEALGSGKMMEFRSKYRYADVFLVDDVQFISGKERTQEEFFHTFTNLYQERKQIVLTSDRPPRDISTLDERLHTRFENGIIADVQPPDLETRIAIIKRKAQHLGLDLGDDICIFIAQKIKNNVRQLEGVVKKMSIVCMIDNERPSIAIASNAIKDILTDDVPTPVAIERIIAEVSRTFEVAQDDIRSNKRSSKIPLARQVAMYVIREVLSLSHEQIGKEFGGKDHTTVIYSVQKVEQLMSQQSDLKAKVEDIIKNVNSN